MYNNPYCKRGDWIDTEWVLKNLDEEYKVIFVGDAAMAPSELYRRGGNAFVGLFNEETGITWLDRFDKRYKKKIWLNPIQRKNWEFAYGRETIEAIGKIFPMFDLTMDGLEKGIKRLLVR